MKLFKAEIEKKSKDDQRTKFIRALLTGVGRVYPYAEKSKNKEVKERVKDLFRLMYSTDFGIVTKTVTLLVKMAKHGEEDVDDKLYTAIYQSLLNSKIPHSTKHQNPYLSSVFSAINRDKNYPNRIKSMIKRLLSLSFSNYSPFTAGVLVIVAHILRSHANLHQAAFRQIAVDPEFESTKIKMEAEDDPEKEPASDSESEHDDTPGWTFGKKSNDEKIEKEEEDDKIEIKEEGKSANPWMNKQRDSYEPSAWNPQYTGSQYTPLWEILELRHHYHPGLGHLADDLLHLAVRDPYSGDPLNDFSMTKFLDRFAYKNPNKICKKDDEITIRAKKKSLFGGLKRSELLAVTSQEFTESKVTAEDEFLQDYFKFTKKKVKVKKEKDTQEIEQDVDSDDEFEKLIGLAPSKKNFLTGKGSKDDIEFDMSSDEELDTIKQTEAKEIEEMEKENANDGDDDEVDEMEDVEEPLDENAGTSEAIISGDSTKKSSLAQKNWERKRIDGAKGKRKLKQPRKGSFRGKKRRV